MTCEGTCPWCGMGPFMRIKMKLICQACGETIETCCDGAPTSTRRI